MRGIWLTALGGLLGAVLAVFYYFVPGTGLDHERGVLLVFLASTLMLAAALALLARLPAWLSRLLAALILLDIIGTGFCAYLLESSPLMAAMVLALAGWTAHVTGDGWLREVIAFFRHKPMLLAAGAAAFALLAAVPRLSGHPSYPLADANGELWTTIGGNPQTQKYSTATQITPGNVRDLKVAWSIHTGDVSRRNEPLANMTTWGATPLFVNDTLYVGTPHFRIFAAEPDTGKVKWVYSPDIDPNTDNQGYKNRGVAYWQAEHPAAGQPCQKMVYVGTMHGTLHGVDADTGKPCAAFGKNGVLNVNAWNTINPRFKFGLVTPPAVYKDTLVLGWAGSDWLYRTENPGTVFGIDARTGALKWTFNPIPKEMLDKTGTANVWGPMSVDPRTGIVYLPVSAPSPNFYGGDRMDEMPLVNATVALKAETGEIVWSRQLVHHDLWDLDNNSPPTLLDIKKDGKTIPALIQSTKQGFLFVLNRLTGEPVYPIEERPFPASDVPGEKASPTQPYVAVPEPTLSDKTPEIFGLADFLSFGQCSRWKARLEDKGRFTPPSLKGTYSYPGTVGGPEWPGGAVDPVTNTYVVNSQNLPQIYTLVPRAEADKILQGKPRVASYYAQDGAPYAGRMENFINRLEMPCWSPPYGTLSSYDMNTGKLLWRKPVGQVQKWGFYMPESWGSITIGGPVITKTGLIFIGASMDSRVRAIDLKTGNVLWKARVDAPAVATPAIYTYKGRQYVVFAAGGNFILTPRIGDQLVAFALPR